MKRKITLQGILIIVAAALLGITGTTVGVMALMSPSSAVTVENFVGKTKKTVETWRTKNSIDSKQVSYIYKYDEEKDKDTVLKQNMKAGTSFTSDSKLRITLSNGADPDVEFELPDFTDQTEKDVKAWFTDHKFTSVTYVYEMSETVTPGNFISMDQEAGAKVKRSAEIKVTFCTPLDSEEVIVPSLASMSRDDIASWAEQHRINVSFVEISNDTISVGSVISVSVNEGQRLKPGDIVTVEISSGPAEEEDRYNGEEKDNSQNNVTPPSNDQVSSGNPSGNTSPSDNQQTGPNSPAGGNEGDNPPVDNHPGENIPAASVYDVPEYQRIVMIAKNEADYESKKAVLVNYFTSYGIPGECIVVTNDPTGTQADIIVSCGTTTSVNNPIYITIVDNTQG